jgi:hypothetical protein
LLFFGQWLYHNLAKSHGESMWSGLQFVVVEVYVIDLPYEAKCQELHMLSLPAGLPSPFVSSTSYTTPHTNRPTNSDRRLSPC